MTEARAPESTRKGVDCDVGWKEVGSLWGEGEEAARIGWRLRGGAKQDGDSYKE